jgi:hypothetical protein
MVPAGIWKTLLASDGCSSEGGPKTGRALVLSGTPGYSPAVMLFRGDRKIASIVVPSAREYRGIRVPECISATSSLLFQISGGAAGAEVAAAGHVTTLH